MRTCAAPCGVNVAHCSNPSYCSFPRLPSSLSSTYRFLSPFPDLPHPTARLASKQASKQARTRTGRHCNAHPLPQSFQPACGLSPHLAPQPVACTRCPHRTAVFYSSIPASKAPPGRLGQGSSNLTAAERPGERAHGYPKSPREALVTTTETSLMMPALRAPPDGHTPLNYHTAIGRRASVAAMSRNEPSARTSLSERDAKGRTSPNIPV